MTTAIRVLSSTAMKTTFDTLAPTFERDHDVAFDIHYAPSARLAVQIPQGLAGDLALLTRPQLDQLAASGHIVAGSATDIAGSLMGLAVQPGAPRPDISTVEAFKATILAAKSLGTSNPVGGGMSGKLLQAVFDKLGIADAVKAKVTYGPGGPDGLIGLFLKRREVEIGIQQMPELMAVPGIDIVGPLPANIQSVTMFSVAALTGTAHSDLARAFGAYLHTGPARDALRAKGLEPA